MIYAILLIGLAMVTAGLKGTGHELGQQLQSDLIGSGGFVLWIAAVLTIGALGFIGPLRQTSRYLIVLLGVVLVLRNGGIWQAAQQALSDASTIGPAPAVTLPAIASSTGGATTAVTGGGSSGGGGILGDIGAVAGIAALL